LHHYLLLTFAVASVAMPPRSVAALPFRWPFNGPLVGDTCRWQAGAIDFYAHLPPPRPANPVPLWEPAATDKLEPTPLAATRYICWAGAGSGETVTTLEFSAPAWSLQLPSPALPPPTAKVWPDVAFSPGDVQETRTGDTRTGTLLFGLRAGSDAGLSGSIHGEPQTTAAARLLAALLNHHDERVRLETVRKLGRFRLAGAVDPLVGALEGDPSAAVREAAAESLAQLEAPGAVSVLRRVAQRDSDLDVRRAAVNAMEALQPRRTLPSKRAVTSSSAPR